MFPKLMSLAGNTIILDIICETPLAACAVFIPVWFSELVVGFKADNLLDPVQFQH